MISKRGELVLKMKQNIDISESDGRFGFVSAVENVCERLSAHCGKIRALLRGFDTAQVNSASFSFRYRFHSAESSLTKVALMNMWNTYVSLRSEVRETAKVGYVDFEFLFPRLEINFETYYTVAVGLLNLIYQMQLMRIYCFKLLKP